MIKIDIVGKEMSGLHVCDDLLYFPLQLLNCINIILLAERHRSLRLYKPFERFYSDTDSCENVEKRLESRLELALGAFNGKNRYWKRFHRHKKNLGKLKTITDLMR